MSHAETRKITVARMEVTPNCQRVHGSLENALMEAMRRAVPACEDAAKHDCNRDATYEVNVKLVRKAAP